MQWFTDMRSRAKLLTAFAAVLVLTVTVGGVSYFSFKQLEDKLMEISQVKLPSTASLLMMQAGQANVASGLRGLLNTRFADPQVREGFFKVVDASLANADSARKVYEPLPQTVDEAKEWQKFVPNWTEWRTQALVVRGTLDKAERIVAQGVSRSSPGVEALHQQAMQEAKGLVAAYKASQTGLDALVKINLDGAHEAELAADATSKRGELVIFAAVLLAIAFGMGIALFLSRMMSNSLGEAVTLLEAVAEGDLTVRLASQSRDETGQMAAALNRALEQVQTTMQAITVNAQTLASASEELASVSTQMGSNAEETSAQSGVVSAAAEQVSKNVQTVATGTEEMSASIKEIAKNAADAARVAGNAVRVAETTNATITKLGDSSAEIGQVIKVITSIAEQTNLLALNATIEAARAGEAGKGFAVVANEVKELAKATAKATEEIGQKIQAIQTDTQGAVAAIGEITAVIAQINEIQTTIAGAVEEQAATTNEIGRNVMEAAKGSSEIAQNITGVAEAAQSTTSGASQTQTAAAELARLASELQGLVQQFRVDDRGAPQAGRAKPGQARGAAAPRAKSHAAAVA